ncbi:MAG: glycosyltransferase family 4 protein [Ruminococcus sp.]|nr:glycosyltransferase family 4 protein [Ruminococcus sp.]
MPLSQLQKVKIKPYKDNANWFFKMKVAYLSYLPLADVDFSYLQEASKLVDITCYIFVNQHHIQKSVISLGGLYNQTGIFDWTIYPVLERYSSMINLNKLKIVNLAYGKRWQLRGIKLFNKLTRELRNYDVIHLPFIIHGFDLPLFRLRKKCVLTVHDPLPHSGSSKIAELCRKISFNLIPRFVLLNRSQKDDFCSTYNINPHRLIVSTLSCYSCLNLVKPTLENIPSEKFILFAGRITKYKGLQFLLPAFKKVHEKFPEIRLIVAGSGTYPFDISEYKDLDYIEFRNRFIPDSELIALIKKSMFMVCPYTDATQSGVVMSAFTFNKPMLATNVGGLPEMVVNNKYGIIVEEKNVDALVEGMTKLLSAPDKLKEYSENIEKDYILGNRSWKKIAKEITDFYKIVQK